MKNASKILFDADNPYSINLTDYNILDIHTDSRQIKLNNLFIAIHGHTVDGHIYIEQAIQKGAQLILANSDRKEFIETTFSKVPAVLYVNNTYNYLSTAMNRFLDYPSHKLNVFGITGTNGKTTTTNILNHILNETNNKSGVIGTIGAFAENYSCQTENTTPDPLVLQNILNKMVALGIDNTVMEVSSIGLMENRTQETDISVAIFTNLTHDHLDFHKSMENYMHAKGKLFRDLKPYNERGEKNFAVINEDEETASYFKNQTQAAVVTYGIEKPADYHATDINYSQKNTQFTLVHEGISYHIETPLIGENNVYNILAAIAGAHIKSIPLDQIIETLKTVEAVSGRLEVVTDTSKNDITVVIDYAHTPMGLEKTLKILRQLGHQKIISVYGCNGDRDIQKRPLMAQIGVDYSDLAIFTSGHPRTEDQATIFEHMRDGLQGDNYLEITDRKEAIEYAIKKANSGDLILIAGKGHENYQIIGREKYPFDDHIVANETLQKRNKMNSVAK